MAWSGPRGETSSPEVVLGGVFRSSYSSFVGLALLLLDDRGQAEEVVQEAFARTLEAWDRLRDPSDPEPYVRRTVINLSRSGLRRRRVVRRQPLVRSVEGVSPEVAVVAAESQREVMDAVSALPRRQRECVVCRYYLDYTTEETADALGVSVGSVKTHLHRALAAIEKRLEDKR